jgi:hypothetical protein
MTKNEFNNISRDEILCELMKRDAEGIDFNTAINGIIKKMIDERLEPFDIFKGKVISQKENN